MGVDNEALKLLLCAKKQGADFAKTLALGRQTLLIRPSRISKILGKYGIPIPDGISLTRYGVADDIFRILGAQTLDFVDYSGYEGANLIHDMNAEIPLEWKQRYSVVFDGGALEHIFNFPIAMKNCMEMLSVGGHFIGVVGMNNFCGHGFYQFSPELYYRIFSEENGFKVKKIFAAQICFAPYQPFWFEIVDPAKIGQRCNLINYEMTYLLVIAEKISNQEVFRVAPMQSDYSVQWSDFKNNNISGTDNRDTLAAYFIQAWIAVVSKISRLLVLPHYSKRFFKRYHP